MPIARQSVAFDLWIVVKPSKDLKGQWVSHCLEVDVVSQGNDPAHALRMGIEAAQMVIADDIKAQRDPGERRAPAQFWKELWAALPHTVPLSSVPNDPKSFELLVAHGRILVPLKQAREPRVELPVYFAQQAHDLHVQ